MSEAAGVVYECRNKACTLGSPKQPGRFTGGITAQQATNISGDPDAVHGDGVCPNCGVKGSPTKERHVSVKGTDPHQKLHDRVAARVADPADKLDADGAQAALLDLIGKAGSRG